MTKLTKSTTSRKRPTRTPQKTTNWSETILAYFIVGLVVYGCFIYDPQSDPLDGMTYTERLRAERDAKRSNVDIYDYKDRRNVRAYNRNRKKTAPAYYDMKRYRAYNRH